MADETMSHANLEDRLKEVERLTAFLRQRLSTHAANAQNALESHKGAMDAFGEANSTFHEIKDGAQSKIAALEARVKALEDQISASTKAS